MTEAEQNSRVGSQIGPYRLVRLLGRGGMGEVFEAYDTVKDRVIALKLITPELSSDAQFRQRMQREAHTAGRLQEPHVVPIHDYGELDGQLFIDMRFVDGTDLAAVLSDRGALPPAEAVAVISQIASALDAAHAVGVLHRDVKPENIMIAEDNFAYLVDFGIAAAAFDENLTQTGAPIGSWKYLAPERFSTNEATYRADIYALTCVLYECLTGTAPFRSDSLPALMAAHLMQPTPRPSEVQPGVPTAFDPVIARGMAKDPDERYPRAGDLALAAHDALGTADQHQAEHILQHSQQPGGPVGSGPFSPFPGVQASPPPWAPPAPPQRRNVRMMLVVAVVVVVVAALAAVGVWLASHNNVDAQANRKPLTTAPITTTSMPPAAALSLIVLSPAAVNQIMGTTNIVLSQPVTQMQEVPNQLSNPACNSAMNPVQASGYANSGYTAVNAQLLHEPGTRPVHQLVQAAVAFSSADQARAFIISSAAQWKACAGQSITQNADGVVYRYTFGTVVEEPTKITLTHTAVDGNGWACQHALSAVSSYVLDAGVCQFQIGDQASRIVDAMAANVPK